MTKDFEFKDKYDINDLISIVSLLRAPEGCPWDREQTHASIKKNFIEETYEVIEAINTGSANALKEELGDVLLQIALHTEMEREAGEFDFTDVADGICKKLILRHPHVFGDVAVNDSSDVITNWEAIKLKEKGMNSVTQSMESVPKELPALMRAQKIQKKAANAGFDWTSCDGAMDKLKEEMIELENALNEGAQTHIEEEFGDVLFSCVNIARFIHADSEEALSAATDKFLSRFLIVENLASGQGVIMQNASVCELDALWNKSKQILSEKSETEEL